MIEGIVSTVWVYPILNFLFGELITFIIKSYRKFSLYFVSSATKGLTGGIATSKETRLHIIAYMGMYVGAWIAYIAAVIFGKALMIESRMGAGVYACLQCINAASIAIHGFYYLWAVGLRDFPYTEAYKKSFWTVRMAAFALWGITGILLFNCQC